MTDSHDPIEAALEVLRSVPPPERQPEHRAAFLEEARRVSAAPLMRLEQMNGRHEERRMSNRRLRRHLLLIAILIALFVAGGVLAQEIIDFFTRGDDDTTTVEVYYSIPPERLDSIPSAATLEQLVSEADYEVQVPTYIPEPYNFTSAHYDTEAQAAVIEYHCEKNDGWGIQIGQLPVDQTEIVTSPVEVGASAIVESVMIGDVEGQYVRGMWVPIVGDPATIEPRPGTSVAETVVWTNDTEWQRLSWMENGIVFSVSTGRTRGRGIAPEPCALDKDDYVAIANSLQPARMLQNLPLLRSPEDTLSVDEVVAQTDFDVLMPTYIPEAYTFESAAFIPTGGSWLNYRCGDVWAISIEQRRVAPDEIPDIRHEVGASADIETVQIGDHTGQYVRGHWLSFPSRTEATPGTPISRPATWTNFSGWQQLVWYADGFLFKIATSGGLTNSIPFPPCSLTKDDYVAIANSLQPASSLPNE